MPKSVVRSARQIGLYFISRRQLKESSVGRLKTDVVFNSTHDLLILRVDELQFYVQTTATFER